MADIETDLLTVEEKRVLLSELKQALYTGARRIRFNDRDVTYQHTSDMRMAVKALEDDIRCSQGGRRQTVVSTTYSRGF